MSHFISKSIFKMCDKRGECACGAPRNLIDASFCIIRYAVCNFDCSFVIFLTISAVILNGILETIVNGLLGVEYFKKSAWISERLVTLAYFFCKSEKSLGSTSTAIIFLFC